MGALRFLGLLVLSAWLGCGSAHAEKRVALVMGNSAYKNVARLANPANDAALVGGMFKKAGFDTIDVKLDLNVVDMRKALREFGGKAREADVAVVYYAGHGIELDGTNYLIPTDAALETDTDVLDEAFPLDRVLFAIEPAKQLRLVILDACRDNPFAKTMKRTVASRAIGRGLAKVEPTSPNTMIAFAAKAGSTASDGDAKNSPFATALVERLPTPGLDLGKAFRFVRDDVLKSTGNKQEPFVYGSLGGDDVSLVPAKPVVTAPQGPQANPQDSIRRDYELALQAGNRDAWEAFLQAYPDGFYAGLARAQLKNVAAEEARAAAAAKARQAEDEKARLAAERADKVEQEKAAATAKAAENAKAAAEKTKQIEEAKAAAAEQRRKDAEAAVAKALADKQAAEKALADKIANDKAAAELAAKQAAEKVQRDGEQKVAAVAPTQTPSSLSPQETAKLVQSELRRVGCLAAAADGDWNASSQRSLTLFNKYAGTKFDAKLASLDALDAIKAKPGRVCPLVCEHGFKADGDACVKITCRAGYRVNDDNECEKVQDKKPVATREDAKPRDDQRKKTETAPAKPQATGQMICSRAGCRPVGPGCRLEYNRIVGGGGAQTLNVEVCN
ncbi:caspase family protein [Bradyrhizobium sp. CCBAU 45384]|uniref:caspase family protein n=1 Tax=Bradyrhizobium sp. CCBAU 45384 TaxID=858428 RepID=UPI002305BCC6|nr:caspase family protein [Bradyrhizobium sp. CCBAU 45384]MDA9407854.1 caspase (peptidase) [Bradyrhizobium sp. CCBAU 45384]